MKKQLSMVRRHAPNAASNLILHPRIPEWLAKSLLQEGDLYHEVFSSTTMLFVKADARKIKKQTKNYKKGDEQYEEVS